MNVIEEVGKAFIMSFMTLYPAWHFDISQTDPIFVILYGFSMAAITFIWVIGE